MTITIIMPVYNDHQAARAIKSVLEQKHQDWQLEILNNGCTDAKTLAAINQFEGRKGVNITHYPTNRQSECGALFGMKVKTPYMAYLFSDDQWHSEYLNRMLAALDGQHAAAFCNTAFVDEDGAVWKKPPDTQYDGDISDMSPLQHLRQLFFVKNTLHPCSMVIKTEAFQHLGGFNPCLHRIGDMKFFAKLLGTFPVKFVKDKLAYITCNSVLAEKKNLSHGNDKIMLEMMIERQQFLEVFATPQFLKLAPLLFGFPDDGNEAWRFLNLGLAAIKNQSPDYIFFGWRCIYRAAELDYEGFNQWSIATHNLSAGEYIKKLQRKAA